MHIARQYPRFGRLLAALAASQLGDWLYNLALLAYVEQRTHSTTWLGLTTAARIAPMVIGGPLGGLLADRLDRRVTMIASDVIRAALMGALVLTALATFPSSSCRSSPPRPRPPASPIPAASPRSRRELVAGEDLGKANGARGTIGPACVAAGPALGAVLLLIGPPSVAFAINAFTFIISGLFVASIPRWSRVRRARARRERRPSPASFRTFAPARGR